MAKIISICNQKGGTGKTTTVVNLSAAIAEKEKRVLVVDMDPQGNATSGMGVNKSENPIMRHRRNNRPRHAYFSRKHYTRHLDSRK